MSIFESGVVERMKRLYGQTIVVQELVEQVERDYAAGRVRSPNGLLVSLCRTQAERAAKTSPVSRSGGPAASSPAESYADFRWKLLHDIMFKHLTPKQVAERLGSAIDQFPGMRAELLAEAALYAVADDWVEVS